MSSAKTERLVNLTMALLGAKRYMTKAEIFRRVAGYSGEPDAKERMFERDKDDLRLLGIEIEVGGHDPLFEDEPGYRISADSYRMPPDSFNSEELGIIATALSNWEGSAFAETSRSLLRRINSLAVAPEFGELKGAAGLNIDESSLLEISEALAKRTTLEFDYQKSNGSVEVRKVNPLGICAWRSAWYLVGEDLMRGDVRVFKLARFATAPKSSSKPGAYEIPEDFAITDYVLMFQQDKLRAKLKLRAEAGQLLRSRADFVERIDDEWDQVHVDFSHQAEAKREILWLGDEVVVLEPVELRNEIVESLREIVAKNG